MSVQDDSRLIETLQAALNEQKRTIDALNDVIAARERASAALQTSVDEYRRTVADLEAVIAEREATIARLQTQLAGAAGNGSGRADSASLPESAAMTLADVAYDALLVVDGDRRVIALNPSARALFAHPQPLGQTLLDLTASPEIDSMVGDALAYQEEELEEQIAIGKRTYRVRARVSHHDGGVRVGLAFQDVTELIRLNRARRDMVANISHELRTPIANIRLIIDSIFHEQEKPKGKQSRNALKAIARETDSLLWLVQELLDLSMIESGQAILRMVEMPADRLVHEAVERLVDQSEAKGLTLVTDIPAHVWVLCDRDQARRVLINLIHNAIKWSPPDSAITVRVTPAGDEVLFAVLDNGPGVPEEYRERIFERFYQVDAARSGEGGSGLGLAICKHIVEAHGGRIWAEGNAAQPGGRFMFTLPSADSRIGDAQDGAPGSE